MISARHPRPGLLRGIHLLALLLVLIGCAGPGRNSVIFLSGTDARLITRITEGLFLTTVRIADREMSPFLIDTGASDIVLDTATGLGVHLASWTEVDHPTFKRKVTKGILPTLEVGPLRFGNTVVGVMDLSFPSTFLEERLAGILGHPFFAQAIVEIDYPGSSIRCFDSKVYRLPRGEWIPLAFHGGRPLIGARMDGNISGQFLLDTGSNYAVLFSPEFVRRHALLDHRETRKHAVVGITERYDTLMGQIEWFEFAGRRFDRPVVHFAPTDLPRSFPTGVDGIIGQDLLKHFTVIFNYPESRVAFLPR
jgi:hypothetical protein